jgi:hypothetical protein
MIIEIKTTRDIERELNKLILEAKDLDKIKIRNEYTEKKWINMDDLLGYLDDINRFQSPALIHANTIIKLIESQSKHSSSDKSESFNKCYEVNKK